MTATLQQGHRSKIERVIPERGGLVISAPVGAPRVRLGYFPPANKFFLYLGFETQEQAMALYTFLLDKGITTRYNHKTDIANQAMVDIAGVAGRSPALVFADFLRQPYRV